MGRISEDKGLQLQGSWQGGESEGFDNVWPFIISHTILYGQIVENNEITAEKDQDILLPMVTVPSLPPQYSWPQILSHQ